MSAGIPGAGTLVADFVRFARRRSAAAIALIVAGALLEGAGIVMLVPIVSLILGVREGDGEGPIASAFGWLGLEDEGAQLGLVLGAFAGVLVLRLIVILMRDDLLARLQAEFVSDLRARAFRRLAQVPWAEVAGLRQGPINHALTRDVDRAANGIGGVLQGGVAVVMLIVQFALAMVLAPLVTLGAAALALGLFRALRSLRKRAERRGRTLTVSDLTMFESVSGFLRGLKPAKAHGLEKQYVAAFEESARQVAEVHRAFSVDTSIARLALQTASGGIGILAILVGLFVLGTPPENLIVTLIILARLYTPLQVIQTTMQIVRHSAEGYRAARTLAGPAGCAKPAPSASAGDRLAGPPQIDLVGVTVAGGDGAPRLILDGVTSTLPSGLVTALIGESGAGKSTFCDVAVGLLTPDTGEVRIDGALLSDHLAQRLRASVAYVGQEPFLFEDTLRNNVCWGCGPVNEEEIWRALRVVGADELVGGLEGGLDGSIRSEGMRFSGGERQRLRLARALLRRPRFLVLDEATSALDLEAESKVLASVLAARDGATVLMVSHRPSTLVLADHVVALEQGRLSEAGPVAELARRPGSRLAAVLVLAGSGAAPAAISPAGEK